MSDQDVVSLLQIKTPDRPVHAEGSFRPRRRYSSSVDHMQRIREQTCIHFHFFGSSYPEI